MTENGFGLMRYLCSRRRLIRNVTGRPIKTSRRMYHHFLVNISFIEALAEKLMEADPTIPPLPLKDVVCSKIYFIDKDISDIPGHPLQQ